MATTAEIDFIVGELWMRRGDRLPLLGLTLESDTGDPLDLTDGPTRVAVCTMMLRHEDGLDALTIPHPGIPNTPGGWMELPAYVYDAPNGVIIYDWPQIETESLRIGTQQLMIRVEYRNPVRQVTVPTARDARLIVRPPLADPPVTL